MVHWDTEYTGRGSGMAGDWDGLEKMVSKLVWCTGIGYKISGMGIYNALEYRVHWQG